MDALPEPIKTRKPQIRPALRDALALIVTEGRSISEAAQTVGMARESLSRALKRPAVIAAKADVTCAWRASRTEKAVLTIADLAVNATSEDVRLKASRTWLELVGELGPIRRDTAPPAGQTIQILVNTGGTGGTGAAMPDGSGVFELPPYAPPSRDGADDEG